MTRRRTNVAPIGEIDPGGFYRTSQSPAIFSLGWQATRNKIRSGKLPQPSPLNEGSNVLGWIGQQIIDHRERMQKIAEQNAAVEAMRPKQEQPAALRKKVQKVRLRRSA